MNLAIEGDMAKTACKKRILFVVEAMGGGVFTYIVDLANELVDLFDMYIAYAVRKQTPKNYKDYFDERVHLIEVKNFGRSIMPTKDFKAVFELRKIVDDIKPDVIHLHSSKAGAIGRLALNGNYSMFYTPHGYSFLMENCNPIKRKIYRLIEGACAKSNCTTISCSKGEHQETQKLTKRAVYVNNGINTKELQTLIDSVETIDEHPFTVFTLGRICYQKNPVLFNQIALAMPEIKFLWIGDGELRSELNAPNIKVTGWCKREDALRFSLGADVFLLTSLWEGMPISLLESMYMKKLCIVSDVIGNHDVIHNRENGFVCHNVDDFVDAIKLAGNHLDFIEQYIERAHDGVSKIYNTKVMAEKYTEIYVRKFSGGYRVYVVFCAFLSPVHFAQRQNIYIKETNHYCGRATLLAVPERQVAA